MSALPRGMVAFLMTDVVGSTRLWQRDANEMDQALVALDADVGRMVVEILDGLAQNGESGNVAVEAKVRGDVAELTRRFPIY